MPRRSLAWGLVVLGLAACGGADKSDPTEPSFRPSPPPANTCNFKTLQSLAGDEFFTAEKLKAADLIKLAQDQGANQPGAEPYLYDLIVLEATTIDAGKQRGTAQVGADFANNVIFCLTAASKTGVQLPIGPDPFDRTKDGAVAVRGGVSTTGVADTEDPIVTRLGGSAIGVKPETGTWADALGGRTIIIAAKNTTGSVGGQIGAAYSWNTVPKRTTLVNRLLVLGICVENPKGLIQEDAAIVQLEPVAFLERFAAGNPGGQTTGKRALCDNDLASAFDDGLGPFAWLKRLLIPRPAYAAAVNPGGTGGKIGGYSTFSVVDAGGIVLTIPAGGQPTNGFTNQDITINVKVNANVVDQTGAVINNAPIEGVIVTATVVGNSGSFNVTPTVPTATTNTSGEATLTFQIDKAGGYTVQLTTEDLVNSTSDLQSYEPVSVTTNLFNLQQRR